MLADILLVVIFHSASDLTEWTYEPRVRPSGQSSVRSQQEIFEGLRQFLALRLVNRLWNDTFRSLRSFWTVIPAFMAVEKETLANCIRLSGPVLPLTLTLSNMPNLQIQEVLDTVAHRLTVIRLFCASPARFYEGVLRPRAIEPNHDGFVNAVKTMEIHAGRVDRKSMHWIRTPPPQLVTLRLTNFEFAKSCVLPLTLRDLALEFTPRGREALPKPMHLADLTGVLSRLPMLEVLCVDMRYMSQVLLSQVEEANLPALKRLTVRSNSPNTFNTFASRIACPVLERAYLSVDFLSRDSPRIDDSLRTASTKLAELVVDGSHLPPNRLDISNIYLDDRESYDGLHAQVTVALAPFVEGRLSSHCLASTAAFVLTVNRALPATSTGPGGHIRNFRDPSSVLTLILEGLPKIKFDMLTVHCRPENVALRSRSRDSVWVFRDAAFLRQVESAHSLNWFGDDEQLAYILGLPNMFPRLERLAIGLPGTLKGFPLTLYRATEERKKRARRAVPVNAPSEDGTEDQRPAWNSSVLELSEKVLVTQMFDEFLKTDGVGGHRM